MAGQQISIEAAYDAYRAKAAELFHENALLHAKTTELEARVEQLQQENELLRSHLPTGQAPQPLSCVEPGVPG
ncbi:hypothetical protein E2C11_23170 [Streptomyces lavendulae]|nr:hypothetical protein [Streptomyces lavendulae]TXJ75416.1 hypothetical protein E2C11_23170 [Streptomyces lavendulae]